MHGCARVCERVCVCTARGGSERQRFGEHVPTELIAAASGSYKYCISRTKIGIHTCCSASRRATRQGKAGSGKHCLWSVSPAPAGPRTRCWVPAPQGHCPRPWRARPSPHGLCQPAAVSAGVQIKPCPKKRGRKERGQPWGRLHSWGWGSFAARIPARQCQLEGSSRRRRQPCPKQRAAQRDVSPPDQGERNGTWDQKTLVDEGRFGVSALVLSLQARGRAARTAGAPAACW